MKKAVLLSIILTLILHTLTFTFAAEANSLTKKLTGYILLQVEENGEAWYVNPNDLKRYYIKDGEVSYKVLRSLGLGITNADLVKIPVGIESRFQDVDTDNDGLPDKLEEALDTNVNSNDTDEDGYLDGVEVIAGYNPNGAGKMIYDYNLVDKLKGRILLQVESRGQAWYINPQNGKRYYMKDGEAAYQIMRFLSLGITNADLEKIPYVEPERYKLFQLVIAKALDGKDDFLAEHGMVCRPFITKDVVENSTTAAFVYCLDFYDQAADWEFKDMHREHRYQKKDSPDIIGVLVEANDMKPTIYDYLLDYITKGPKNYSSVEVIWRQLNEDEIIEDLFIRFIEGSEKSYIRYIVYKSTPEYSFGILTPEYENFNEKNLEILKNVDIHFFSNQEILAYSKEIYEKIFGKVGAKDRDSKRISDIKKIQTALELYYNDFNSYPIGENLILGEGNTACLGSKGFGAIGCDSPYMKRIKDFEKIPANPKPNGSDYIYTRIDERSYNLLFTLETDISGLKAGRYCATEFGVSQKCDHGHYV